LTHCIRVRPVSTGETEQVITMEDIVFVALSVVFFVATIGMTFLFDRLRERR